MSLEQVEFDGLRDNEVLVRIQACGICHTDIKFQQRIALPGVFGHEGTGVVEDTGAKVDFVQAGDRVVLSYPSCGQCPPCNRDEPFRCEKIPALKFAGQRPDGSKPISVNGDEVSSAFFQQSSFATRAVVLDRSVVPVDTNLPAELLAALPCGVQTGAGAILNTFKAVAGDSLVIFGAGSVGLSAIMAARLMGVSPIIAVDLVPSRLELALELGASAALNASAVDVPSEVKKLLPHGARFVFESSDSIAALNAGIECLAQGGEIGIVSAPPSGKTFPFTTRGLFDRVASLHGIVQGHSVPRSFIPKLIQFHAEGRFPFERLVTTYPFADIDRAISDAEAGKVIKPVLLMP